MAGKRLRNPSDNNAIVGDPGYADRRTEILNKGLDIFKRYGYRKTTIEDIGKACGLGKAALYHYFSSKEELFAEMVRTECGRMLTQMHKAANATDDPKAKIVAIIKTRFKFIRNVLLGSTSSIGNDLWEVVPLANDARQEYFQKESLLIQEILEQGIKQRVFKSLQSRIVSNLIIFAMYGIDFHFAQQQIATDNKNHHLTEFNDEHSIEENVEMMLNLFFDGICR